jgi:plastocyanin
MKTLRPKRHVFRWSVAGAVGWVFASCHLTAAIINVNIVNYAFSPNAVSINVNDQVKWTWLGNYHSTTSNGGLWDSGVNNSGYTYTTTFNSVGSFPYYCSYHYFTGTVTVQAISVPPTVAITNPPTGTVLSAPASLTLEATAGESGGNITNVQFFQGVASLGSVRTAPYSFAVNGLLAGNYTFSAVAVDNAGLTVTNSITVHVVTPVPATFSALRRVSASSFQFDYAANAGLRYVVQRSGDLKTWIGINTNTASGSTVSFLDNNASLNVEFYRVRLLPNP